MAADSMNDTYSVKNLLFYRAIPNYELPLKIDGHNTYACKDCGDRFFLESSYENHIQRKSVQITYKCRYCNRLIIFHNRCNLLSHIRSHTFKTATINVSDLKIDPLPLSFYKLLKRDDLINTVPTDKPKQNSIHFCYECKKNVSGPGPLYKERANHYMEYTNKVYSCPVCLFTLPTTCALKAHLRIHLVVPPFYCPECGMHIPNNNIKYPYIHSCEGFNMMRATARYPCPVQNCNFFHPNNFKTHMKETHLKKIFSCPSCVVACFNENTMKKHLKSHDQNNDALIFYQCELCPGRLVMESHVDSHINHHGPSQTIYPCWICSTTFKEVAELIHHHLQNHDPSDELKNCLNNLKNDNVKKIYRVVKRCDQCMRNFTYRCHYDDINILPNSCPYKCMPHSKSLLKKDNCTNTNGSKSIINCPICLTQIDQNWTNIKEHFALHHKEHRCLDLKLSLPRICVKQHLKQFRKKKVKPAVGRNIRNKSDKEPNKTTQSNEDRSQKGLRKSSTKTTLPYYCGKCQDEYDTKELLENHIMTAHRDPCMAYQCLECGDSFVVKPSFSIHLLFHGITDVEEYISMKKCYNENALNKCANDITIEEVPLDENQCQICRERFDDTDDLKKHFRVHGMAFLMKNSYNKHA